MHPTEKFPAFLVQASLCFYLIYKMISFSLWININREFPLIPYVNLPDQVLLSLDLIINMAGFILLILLLFKPRGKTFLCLFILVEIMCLLLDQIRWQPLSFQLIIFFSVLYFYPQKAKHFLLALLVATYFFSGLHKLNPGFNYSIWSKLFLMDFLEFPIEIAHYKWIKLSGYGVGLLEITFAIALLTRWHAYAKTALVLMHLSLLIFFLSTRENPVVIPWNGLMMIYLLYFLYTNYKKDIGLLWTSSIGLRFFMLIIFLLPFFRFWEAYPPYFSFDLYSGNEAYLFALSDDNDYKTYDNQEFSDICDTDKTYTVSLTIWTLEELKVPIPPDIRLYKTISDRMKKDQATDFVYLNFPYRTNNCHFIK